MLFTDLIDKKEILEVIKNLGYKEPTDIQKEIIPLIKEGYDVTVQPVNLQQKPITCKPLQLQQHMQRSYQPSGCCRRRSDPSFLRKIRLRRLFEITNLHFRSYTTAISKVLNTSFFNV